MSRQRRRRRLAAALLAGSVWGCRQPAPPPPPQPPPARAFSVEELPASTRVDLVIADLAEMLSEDKVEVIVSGSVVNRGTRPTNSVHVRVRALDRNGAALREAQVTPSSERIPPGGGTARFSAVFPNDPAVVDYHIEAIGYGRKVE